jgi:hypothetical protein
MLLKVSKDTKIILRLNLIIKIFSKSLADQSNFIFDDLFVPIVGFD